MREKFQRKQTDNEFRNKCNTKGYNLYNHNNTLVSPIYTFSLPENKFGYAPNQETNREKYFNQTIYDGKTPTLVRKNTSPSISSFMNLIFSIFQRKNCGSNPTEMDIKMVIPAPTQ